MKRIVLSLLALATSLPALAETPQQMLAGYAADAARERPGFAPSAERGRQFYIERRSAAEKMPNCASCHTEDATAAGKHVITSKAIEPLAPIAGSARFSESAKTEKWFRRNCKEVVGRECSAAEKADLLRFLLTKAGA
jgi:cytochrome c peroxidase